MWRFGFGKRTTIIPQELAESRKTIYGALESLKSVTRSRPGSFNIQSFLTAKRKELIDIFGQAEKEEQNNVIQLLKKLDPSNASEYEEILNQ